MPVEVDTLQLLRERHPTSSWAIWSPTFPEDGAVEEHPEKLFEYIRDRRDELRPAIVLLSLNPSSRMPSSFQNFHSTEPKHRNDQFRDFVEESGLEGAYMTDLVERTVDPDSSNVEPTTDDVDNLLGQLELLGQDEYHLICFHQKILNALKEAFQVRSRDLPHNISAFSTSLPSYDIHFYRVWFHANWGANKDKIPELRDQLSYLSSNEIGTSSENLSDWTK